MAINLDEPPFYDVLTKRERDYMSDVWRDWMATFYQSLTEYVTQFGIIVPNLTTVQRDSIQTPQNGQLIYNTDTNEFQGFSNGAWIVL